MRFRLSIEWATISVALLAVAIMLNLRGFGIAAYLTGLASGVTAYISYAEYWENR